MEQSISKFFKTARADIKLDHWSNSQDMSYRQCPIKWYLGSYLRLTKKDTKPALRKGLAVHKAMETFYCEHPKDRHPDLMIEAHHQYLMDAPYKDAEERQKEMQIGESVLLQYFNEYGKDESIPKATTEYAGEIIVPGTDIPFVFRIDLAVLEGDRPFILDFKSGASPSAEDYMTYEMQLLRYIWALRELGIPAKDILYQTLKMPKTTRSMKSEFQRLRHTPSAKEIGWAVADMAMMLNEINRDGKLLYTNWKKDCAWSCDFHDVHLTAKLGGDPMPVLEELYKKRDEE